MEEEQKDIERQRKGFTLDSQHMDTSFDDEVWNSHIDDFEVLRDGHDADDIARQVAEMTEESEAQKLTEKFENLEEYSQFLEDGGESPRDAEIGTYIDEQIKRAEERARMLESNTKGKGYVDDRDRPGVGGGESQPELSEFNKEAMEKYISMFEDGNEYDDEDDDEFTIL